MEMDATGASNGSAVELDKVIALFTGPNSADLHERHVAAIHRLCRTNPNGFAIRDLPKVQEVLELSVALLKRGSMIFLDPLCQLVSVLGKPFIRRTATDEFKMLNHITNLLAAVGSVLRTAGLPTQLYLAAAQMITTFANAYGSRPNALELAQQPAEPDGVQRQYHTNQSLLNKSGVVADLITALARLLLLEDPAASTTQADAPPPLLVPLTTALVALSYNTDNCTAMVEAGVLQCLAALLARGPGAETTSTAVELTWNVVENAPSARTLLSRPLPSLQSLATVIAGGAAAAAAGGGGGDALNGEASALSSASLAPAPSGSGLAAAGPGPGSRGDGGGGGGRSSGLGMAASVMSSSYGYDRMNGSLAYGSELGREAGSSRGSIGTPGGFGLGPALRPGSEGGGGSHGLGDLGDASGRGSHPGDDPDDAYWQLGAGAAANGGGVGHGGYDEFGDSPDIRFGELGLGLAGSSFTAASAAAEAAAVAGGDGGGEAAAAAAAAAAADAPVVQTLADALTGLLRSLLLRGFSKADKELRNDVMVVLNLLLEAPDFRAAASFTGVFEPLLAAATAPELANRPDLVANYALTTDTLDHELRLLVWGALQLGCLLPEVLEAAAAGGFVRVLLLYVSPGPADSLHPAVRRWNPDQLATLRSAALSKLHALAPLCPEEYERAGGPPTLLGFIAAAVPGTAAGPAPAAAHLEGALRHLHRLFSLVPESRDVFGAAGILPVLLGIVADAAGSGAGGATLGRLGTSTGGSRGASLAGGAAAAAAAAAGQGQSEAVRHFALLCVSALCTVHAENQRRLRKAGGVAVLMGALARLRGLDPLLPSPYAVAVFDCVWAAVVPDRKSAARFLVDQGMDLILAHLECGNKGHRPVALRVLSDLLENPRSHPFFHDWQSDVNKQTAAHLLLSIWMEEDSLRGMTGPDGLVANPSRPLAGLEKRTKWLPPENVAYGNMSPAKKETVSLIMDNLAGEVILAKVYGVFKLIGFDACPYLDPRDHAVLAAVEKYAKFRQGDVWRSIQAEFDASDMRPTAPDRIRLESGIELSESLAVAVREAQARLLGRAQEGLRQAEAKLFDGMRSQAKLEAEYRTIQLQERTPMTLAEMRRAKEQKATMLKNSLQSFEFQQAPEED